MPLLNAVAIALVVATAPIGKPLPIAVGECHTGAHGAVGTQLRVSNRAADCRSTLTAHAAWRGHTTHACPSSLCLERRLPAAGSPRTHCQRAQTPSAPRGGTRDARSSTAQREIHAHALTAASRCNPPGPHLPRIRHQPCARARTRVACNPWAAPPAERVGCARCR